MSKIRADDVIGWFVSVAFIVLILLGLWWFSSYKCQVRWEQSGMESDFRLFAGCLVKTQSGWIPDDRIREVQP